MENTPLVSQVVSCGFYLRGRKQYLTRSPASLEILFSTIEDKINISWSTCDILSGMQTLHSILTCYLFVVLERVDDQQET